MPQFLTVRGVVISSSFHWGTGPEIYITEKPDQPSKCSEMQQVGITHTLLCPDPRVHAEMFHPKKPDSLTEAGMSYMCCWTVLKS